MVKKTLEKLKDSFLTSSFAVGQKYRCTRDVSTFTAKPSIVIKLGANHIGIKPTTKFHLQKRKFVKSSAVKMSKNNNVNSRDFFSSKQKVTKDVGYFQPLDFEIKIA